MKARVRWIASLTIAISAFVGACQGTNVDTVSPDDFFNGVDGVGVIGSSGVGSGGIVGICPGYPVTIHTTLSLNGAPMREDAKAVVDTGIDPLEIEGVLGAVGDDTFEVDACALVTCDQPALYSVSVDAGGQALVLPPAGTFVRLTYVVEGTDAFAVVLDNAPALEGMANPVDTTAHVWFEAMNGFAPDVPFSASFTLTDRCYTEDGTVTARNMYVDAVGDPDERIEVRMGETMPWTIPVGPNAGTYDVTNFASYTLHESAVSSLLVVRH